MHTHVSRYSHECASKTDMEEKKWLNKVIILVFYAHKKYYHSFVILRLNHWCHMDYFNEVLTTFMGLSGPRSENNVHIVQTNWTLTSIKPGSAQIGLVSKHQHPLILSSRLKTITFWELYCHELMWASKFLLSLALQPKDQSFSDDI